MLGKIIRFFLENKLLTTLLLLLCIGWGTIYSPFNFGVSWLPYTPVPVDVIPDMGDNQQIVFTSWNGKSPQDVEEQISYPLTTALLGIPGVKTIRSNSIFGLSSIYIIFDEEVEFYWSRTRILEKLNSLPNGTIPNEVKPSLGPDATALGQIFWYTLEGRDPATGKTNGGWDPQELRTIQDYYVTYSLTAAKGVSEVASIGGFVKEYHVDIDPIAMREYNVDILGIMNAVKKSNLDIGVRTIEFNRVEYLLRGLGNIKSIEDLEKAVIAVNDNTPIHIKDVAKVSFGPATRRGGLDKEGIEAVGGVVVARHGANPLDVINNIKEKIKNIAPGLPSKILPDGSVSKITIIPFYDRTGLINETLGTLRFALEHEILITILVVLILVMNIRASIIISSLLPIAVLMTFIMMHHFGVGANVVALSGIAIAIGVMVDVGIVFTENILRHLNMPQNKGVKGKELLEVIYTASVEISSAVLTTLATTIVSFFPVFAMQASEGKFFKPLAFTKTFALFSSLMLGFILIPSLANWLFSIQFEKKRFRRIWSLILIISGIGLVIFYDSWVALALVVLGITKLTEVYLPLEKRKHTKKLNVLILILIVLFFLTKSWMPLEAKNTILINFTFIAGIIGFILAVFMIILYFYADILSWILKHKRLFLSLPLFILLFGAISWYGFNKMFGFIANGAEKIGWNIEKSPSWQLLSTRFPGLGNEFLPTIDEGSFLLMPTTMAHSGIEENIEVVRKMDRYISSIPEVSSVIGKWGRVNSALDPAPISMFENMIDYIPEYKLDKDGRRLKFKVDKESAFLLKNGSSYSLKRDGFRKITDEELIPEKNGTYFRQWRPHIKSSNDIWNEIVKATNIPGMTSAPKLQPIQTRNIMLSTGMRAPIGIKVYGPNLETIEKVGIDLEKILKNVPSIKPESVFADRIIGKPYLEFKINRDAIARYGLSIADFQTFIGVAIGGNRLTTTIEGREHLDVRVRYARELRDNPDDIKKILIPTPMGVQIPLGQLVEIAYRRGPQMIKSEDTFLVGYVIFDQLDNIAEIDAVEEAKSYIESKITSRELVIPAGVNYKFTGNYENQIRSTKKLAIVIPISMLIIFLILYFQFGNAQTTLMVFTGIFVAFSGGFIMLWLYSQDWFMNFSIASISMRDLFQIHTINLSVAVWVGFIALFGIATDDGVIMATYLKQVFDKKKPVTKKEIHKAILHAGSMRVRPAMMTTAVTIIALIPVLSSAGKGSNIMLSMAVPAFGGMIIQVITIFIIPVLYCSWKEIRIKK